MKILPEPLSFEWDEGNQDKNTKKHNVPIKEAEEAFENEPFVISEDRKHSKEEKRFQALGRTNQDRWLFLSFTLREDKVRIISVRNVSRKERKVYEEKI